MGQMPDTTVRYDELPRKMQKKIMKRYEHLSKKHPGITQTDVARKIEKQLNVKFAFE